MLMTFKTFLRRVPQFLNRDEWLARLLGLSLYEGDLEVRGLILIQIDALSYGLLRQALEQGRMPFVKSMLESGCWRLRPAYSGMPCCTPVVQAELFYGIPGAIPAFQFFDKASCRVFTMHVPWDAAEVEKRIAAGSRGLLEGGSCYSNVLTGGAAEPHFCVASLGLAPVFARRQAWVFLLAVLLHIFSFLRAMLYMVVELFLAIFDFFRGILSGHDFWKELTFIPSRAAVGILLREVIHIGVKMDIARGLPVIQCNFMGYHDQSHRRGAASRFALWTLRGIDYTIRRIARAGARGRRRKYDLWIYSDHGQEDTVPYSKAFGANIQENIARILQPKAGPTHRGKVDPRLRFLGRIGFRRKGMFKDLLPIPVPEDQVVITSLSQMANLYLPVEISMETKVELARLIREEAHVPTVLIPHDGCEVLVVPPDREPYELRLFPERLLPADHRRFEEMVTDFIAACNRKDAPQLICCGWEGPNKPYYTFTLEHGSHGGVGPRETSPFVILPDSVDLPDGEEQCPRPMALRKRAMELLGREP